MLLCLPNSVTPSMFIAVENLPKLISTCLTTVTKTTDMEKLLQTVLEVERENQLIAPEYYKQRHKITFCWERSERLKRDWKWSKKHLFEFVWVESPRFASDSTCFAAKDKSTIAFAWDHSEIILEPTWIKSKHEKYKYLIENRDDAIYSMIPSLEQQKIKFQHKST